MNAHAWPGNIRELRNTLSRLVLWCPHATISAKAVNDAMFATFPAKNDKSHFDPELLNQDSFKLENLLGEIAVKYIEQAVGKAEGNRRKAADLLGFANYQTMNNWIRKYGDGSQR